MLDLFRATLWNAGVTQICALSHPRAALDEIYGSEHPYDVVISDLNMPDIDGLEFLRLLTQLDFCGAVILVSGEDRRFLRVGETLGRAHRLRILGVL